MAWARARVDVPALLILDGTGIEPNKESLLKWNGDGKGPRDDIPALAKWNGGNIPGFTCPTALDVAPGMTYSGKSKTTDTPWFRIPTKIGDQYRINITESVTGVTEFFVFKGTTCASKTLIDTPTFFPYELVYDPQTAPFYFFELVAPFSTNYDYTFLLTDVSLEGLEVTGVIIAYGGSSACWLPFMRRRGSVENHLRRFVRRNRHHVGRWRRFHHIQRTRPTRTERHWRWYRIWLDASYRRRKWWRGIACAGHRRARNAPT